MSGDDLTIREYMERMLTELRDDIREIKTMMRDQLAAMEAANQQRHNALDHRLSRRIDALETKIEGNTRWINNTQGRMAAMWAIVVIIPIIVSVLVWLGV